MSEQRLLVANRRSRRDSRAVPVTGARPIVLTAALAAEWKIPLVETAAAEWKFSWVVARVLRDRRSIRYIRRIARIAVEVCVRIIPEVILRASIGVSVPRPIRVIATTVVPVEISITRSSRYRVKVAVWKIP